MCGMLVETWFVYWWLCQLNYSTSKKYSINFSGLYSLNEKNAAEREANSQPQAAASNNLNSYASPAAPPAPIAPASPAQSSYGRQERQFN